nr:T9SS type A sorting domain-containing protein [Bacteroidota bacterium]
TLNNVKNVRFKNCTFTNNSNLEYAGIGIQGNNSTFLVEGECTSTGAGGECLEWDNGSFQNLEYGIHATAISSTRFAGIRYTDFNNNFKGVYISAMTNALVKDCNFGINTVFASNGGYGLYLDNSTSYTIEENNFYSNEDYPTGIGMIVNNSGSDPNEVYRNWFTNLEQGISAQELNRNFDEPAEGLQILCCVFDDCDFDILVPRPERIGWGIAPNQGAYSTNPEDMAGNLFHIPDITPNGDYDDINNEGSHITYYYSTNNNDSRVVPIDYTSNSVTPDGRPCSPSWTFENGCPPNESGSGSESEEEMRANLTGDNQDIVALGQSLAILVDGGDTETLNNEVATSIPPETAEVYNELMAESPNLSETVVGSTIEKEDVIPGSMLRDIMVANPHTAKSDVLMDKLDERFDPLPGYMKAQILTGRSLVSLKEEMESNLARHKLKKARAFNGLIHYYSNPANVQGGNDSVLLLLQQDGDLQSKYRLAMLQLEAGNWQQGESILENLPALYNLQEDQLAAHQNMVGFYNMAVEVMASDSGWHAGASGQIQQLYALVSEIVPASVYAKNILISLGEMTYEEPILMPDLYKSSEAIEEYNQLLASEPPSLLEIYPNPAKDYLIIGYTLDMTEVNGVVEIKNLKGELVTTIPFTEPVDKHTVLTQNWKSGTYIVTLVVNGKVMESIKFILID